jgi:hypothetical protein
MRNRFSIAVIYALLLIATSGCGSKHPDIVPVSGTVTIDGKPLTQGVITVAPQGHRPSTGEIDENGRFTLTCFEPGDGALKGTHLATVAAVEPVSERSNRWHAPREYANRIKSGLWVTIDGPTDDLNIELTWAKSGKEKGPFVDNF